MNSKLLNDIRKTILKVTPQKSDFDALSKLFSSMDEDEAKALFDIFAKQPSLITEIIENIKVKKNILEKNNQKEWQNIVKKEEKILSNFLQNLQ